MIKEILPDIIKNIKDSYFAEIDKDAADKVITHITSLAEQDKRSVLSLIAKLKTPDVNEWNLYAVAWRTIERTVKYSFQIGDTIKFNRRIRTIKSIDLKDRSVSLENGEIAPLVSIKEVKINSTPEQLSLF